MKKLLILVLLSLVCCTAEKGLNTDHKKEKKDIHLVLNQWHQAAAEANFKDYFYAMDSISVFIGTDASENWTKKDFEDFSKPYFDQGKAWSFSAVERNIYLNSDGNFAWFDELLNTWMGACRGSGVLEKKNDKWKIKHYVLSVTVPNEDIEKVIDIKMEKDSIYLSSLKLKF